MADHATWSSTGSGLAWAGLTGPDKARMGWTFPFVPSHGTSFSDDWGAVVPY